MATSATVFTIGHSNLSMSQLLHRLQANGIKLVIDVRSSPRSRHVPQFNQEHLAGALAARGIQYRHSGEHLGGRPQDGRLYTHDGQADYHKMAETPGFQTELGRIIAEAGETAVALLCTEHDPDRCHRALLVGQQLHRQGCHIKHIGKEAAARTHEDLLQELELRHGTKGQEDAQQRAVDAQTRIAAYRKRNH